MSLSAKKSKRMEVDFDNPCPPAPREVFFDLNNTCNSKCFFCSNKKIGIPAFLDKKLGFRLLKEFFDFGTKDAGLFATGEPFIRNDLSEFVYEAKRIGYEYTFLNTNGISAVPEKAKRVLDAGLDSIKFSINAGTKETYKKIHGVDAFDTVISNIKWFNEYRKKSGLKYKIYFSMVFTSLNEGEWPKLCDIVAPYVDATDQRSCSNQGGNMLENNSTEKIDPKNLLGSLKKTQCTGKCPDIFSRCTVTPQGYLSACVVDYRNYLIIADLNTANIKDLWHGQEYVKLRRKHMEGALKGLICNNCLHNCDEEAFPLRPEYVMPFKE